MFSSGSVCFEMFILKNMSLVVRMFNFQTCMHSVITNLIAKH